MKIDKIKLSNFRNLKKLEYECIDNLNIFVGNNAQGKTNFLEVIYALSTGASFRTRNNEDLLNFNSDSLTIRAIYKKQGRQISASLKIIRGGKKNFSVNNNITGYKNDDRLRVVLFTPDDLYMVKGAPFLRRDFMDFALKQVSEDYSFHWNRYKRILKKRNDLLRNNETGKSTYQIINEMFVDHACRVIIARINFVNILDEIANKVYKKINQVDEQLKIRYALSFPIDSGKINIGALKQSMVDHLNQIRDLEIKRKSSVIGPHVDDVNIYHNNKAARYFASQGQQRNIALAIKLSEIYTYKKIMNFYPVFLLDEVLSELDYVKKQQLIDYLANAEFQSFLTSVHLGKIHGSNSKITVVENGRFI
ncbi:MAG: DNA replication/repair protein RecF [Syntrophomonadaceae bacterium]